MNRRLTNHRCNKNVVHLLSNPHRTISASAGAVLIALLMLLGLPSPASANESLVEKGEMLATVADCESCHSAKDGKPFAGGHVIESPFGDLVTPNITPDTETGIGDWTLEEFRKVLHEGVNKEGEHMYPAMPYRFYTGILDDDVDAIWAYMQSVEPVNNEVAEHDMSFPANVRMGLAVWKELNTDPGRFEPVADRDEIYNRGKYLVDSLAHCSACHTPRNLMMGVRNDAKFTGAVVDDWYAPNISSGSLSVIDDWSIEDLTEYLQTGRNQTNTKAVGAMATKVHESLALLEDSDVIAMSTYLKTMPAPEEESGEALTAAVAAAENRDSRTFVSGRALYAENCLGCHQPGGKGIDGAVPALAGTSVVTAREPNTAILLVLQGHEIDDNSWGAMPAFGALLQNGEIADVVNYIRTAWSDEGMKNASVELVSELRAGADIPDADQQRVGLFCPIATGELAAVADGIEEERIKGSAQDSEVLGDIVAEVQASNEEARQRDVITAMSTRYCQVLALDDTVGIAELNSRVAEFSGKVAAATAETL